MVAPLKFPPAPRLILGATVTATEKRRMRALMDREAAMAVLRDVMAGDLNTPHERRRKLRVKLNWPAGVTSAFLRLLAEAAAPVVDEELLRVAPLEDSRGAIVERVMDDLADAGIPTTMGALNDRLTALRNKGRLVYVKRGEDRGWNVTEVWNGKG